MSPRSSSALLVLEDGSCYEGQAQGARATVVGEMVFNTSMVGYQEILTDPSYYGQIVNLTAPQIGNYGICEAWGESDKIHAFGLVAREITTRASHFQSTCSLPRYLEAHQVPAIVGVDTRHLTLLLREKGALGACLSTEGLSKQAALEKAKSWQGLHRLPCTEVTSTTQIYRHGETEDTEETEGLTPLAVLDFGLKRSILRELRQAGFQSTVFPFNTSVDTLLESQNKAIFLSNGPGDPACLAELAKSLRKAVGKVPLFGICMGCQVLAHTMGAGTYKLKFGHHGGNHPVQESATGQVRITAQNHGYACEADVLKKAGCHITHLNLTDESVEGFCQADARVFAVQYHPEGGPGPLESRGIFSLFRHLLAQKDFSELL